MIKMVVFDMAGTTVDEDNVVYKTLMKVINDAGYNFNLSEVLAAGAGKEKLQAIKDILKLDGRGREDQFAEELYEVFDVALAKAYEDIAIKPQDGAEELFKTLQQKNIVVILNTGYNQSTARGLLKKLNWSEGAQIDGLITATDVKNNRPMPDMIQLAMSRFFITDPKQVVKVGDSIIDIQEGQNAGCGLSIGITTGAHTQAQLESAAPDYVIHHLGELLPLLKSDGVSIAIEKPLSIRISASPVYAAIITFLTYAMVYGFRKPFTVATYDDVSPLWGVSYKSCLVISQVLGYMMSKFYGVRFIAELKRFGRGKMILVLVGISWLALLVFALVPAPYNIPLLFLNGFPLGLIWGIVFSFVEGRKATDFIGAALAVSFIFSSGFVKTVTGFLQLQFAISEFWLPFFAGLVFLMPLLLFIWLLEKIPPPSAADQLLRTERKPMLKQDRKAYLKAFFPGIVTLLIIYVFLTVFRDIRDNFAADMWVEMGFAGQPEKFVQTEIPTTIIVLVLISAMVYIRNNLKALLVSHIIIGIGFLLAGIATLLFLRGDLAPFYWMTLVGLGLYMGYIPFNCVLFDRMIATFKYAGNVGFLIYLADSYGYLGSVAVILSKSVFHIQLSWTRFYSYGVMTLSVVGLLGTIISAVYFKGMYNNKFHTDEK